MDPRPDSKEPVMSVAGSLRCPVRGWLAVIHQMLELGPPRLKPAAVSALENRLSLCSNSPCIEIWLGSLS
jgi:hypothetical protein